MIRISHAASPRDEILRLIPDDAGLCILVQDLRGSAERLQQSPFAQALAASPLGRSWRDAPETQQLAAIDQQLQTHLDISAVQFRDDILGDAVAIAVTPGPPGKPELDQGLLLVHARDPQRLAALIAKLNELQKKSGEVIGLETREAASQKYIVRKKKDGAEFYWLSGSLFAFSDSEERIRKSLECQSGRPPADDVPPTQLRRLQALGVERNLFIVWVNPRSFDAAVEEKRNGVQGTEAAVLKNFSTIWQAVDGAALSVRLDREASIGVSVQARSAELPPALRGALTELSQPTKLWAAFPENALFVAAGRSPWLLSAGSGEQKPWQVLLDRGIGAAIGSNLLNELLSRVGPEFGLCLAPPDAGGSAWVPSFTAAMQWRSPIDSSLLAKVDAFLQLVVAGINAQHAARLQMRSESQGPIDVRTLDGGSMLPAGFQPSIAWKSGYLVVASSPEAIRRFQPAETTDAEAKGRDAPVMRLALGGWASYLRTHRGPVEKFAADANQLPLDVVRGRLDRLLETLDLFEAVEMSHRTDADRTTITLRVRTAKPMLTADKKPH